MFRRSAARWRRGNEASAPTAAAGAGSGSSATQLSYGSYVIRKFVDAAADIRRLFCWLCFVRSCAGACNIAVALNTLLYYLVDRTPDIV